MSAANSPGPRGALISPYVTLLTSRTFPEPAPSLRLKAWGSACA